MKSLVLKTFSVGSQTASYKDLLSSCVNQPPREGFTPDEMRKRLKVLDKLEESKDTLELEDAEAETLKACVSEMKWAILNKDVLALCDEVKSL